MNWASIFLVFLAVAIYSLVHSGLASLAVKARARRWFGPTADRWYRLAYNLLAAVTFLPVLALLGVLPDQHLYTIPFPWIILTLVVQVLAGLALVSGVLQTGVWSFLGICQLIEPAGGDSCAQEPHLVVTGLYRFVRHPLYTAGLAFIWLIPRMTVNLLTLDLGLTGYIFVGAWLEERKLLREYGDAYAGYRQRTPMLLPIPRRVTDDRSSLK